MEQISPENLGFIIFGKNVMKGKNEYWYHGTPDVSGLEKEGGFTSRNISVEYLKDIKGYYDAQNLMKKSRESGDEDTHWKVLDSIPSFKDHYTMRKPVFLSNNYSVAKTYADPRRASDYQTAREKVLKIDLDEGSVVKIVATGDRFRFIEVTKIKQGFVNAGVPSNKVDELVERLVFAQPDKTRMKTNAVAVLGEWFGFDYIDVVGVLDSYHGGSIKSTVRMVFDVSKIKIVNNMSENKLKESFEEYSNDALTDMIVNLSRYEGNEEAIQRVKMELNKRKGISEGSENFKGGLADNMTPKDLADKHGVPLKQIQSQLTKGTNVEMEHTDTKSKAREIAMDHIYEDPKYYDKLKKIEETRSIIKKLLRENVQLSITDEAPDSISVLVQYNRNAGIITVTPSPKEVDRLQLVDMKFKEGYQELHIIQDALNALWQTFPDINSMIVTPKPESIAFWNKMGFSRISPKQLISNRGH
jgi:hypothetical protein